MATEFKGMAKDSFLDGLVNQTGLNGHELYDYLLECIAKNPKVQEKEHFDEPTKEGEEFYGNLTELREYFKAKGGSDKIAKFMGSYAPDFAASVVAGELGMEWFAWIRPTRFVDGTIRNWCFYGAYNWTSGKWDKTSDCAEEDWKKFLDNGRKPLPLNFH